MTDAPPYEVITRSFPGGAKRDSATAGTALGAIAAGRHLLREAFDDGCRNPVCDFLVFGKAVLVGATYRDLSRAQW